MPAPYDGQVPLHPQQQFLQPMQSLSVSAKTEQLPTSDAPDTGMLSLWPESAPNGPGDVLSSLPAALLPPKRTMEAVLLQEPGSYEPWEVAKALRAAKLPVQILRGSTANLRAHSDLLRSGACAPVGNAEFLRAAMRATGIQEPIWTCYPRALAAHMLQQPRRTPASRALASTQPLFVKPVSGKPFKGFVLRQDRDSLDAFARQQLERLLDRPRSELVWIAAPLRIVSEWRYYVLEGEVVGFSRARPSDGAGLPTPQLEDVSGTIAALPSDCAYALDVAVLDTGQVTVLGARDAWALELIPFGAQPPAVLDYLKMLWLRWSALWATTQLKE